MMMICSTETAVLEEITSCNTAWLPVRCGGRVPRQWPVALVPSGAQATPWSQSNVDNHPTVTPLHARSPSSSCDPVLLFDSDENVTFLCILI